MFPASGKPGKYRRKSRLLAAFLSVCMFGLFMPLISFSGELRPDPADTGLAVSDSAVLQKPQLVSDMSVFQEPQAVNEETHEDIQGSEGSPESVDAMVDEDLSDNGTVQDFALKKSFTCKSKGYRLSLPSDAYISDNPGDFDAKITTNGCVLHITKEWSPYLNPVADLAVGIQQIIPDFKWNDGKDQYFGYYQSRFILNRDWQRNNGVTVSDVQNITAGGFHGMMYSAVISNLPDYPDGYTYLFLKLNSNFFLRIVSKYHSNGADPSDNAEQIRLLRSIASSLSTFTPSEGDRGPAPQYRPERTAPMSEETRAMYDRILRVGRSGSKDDSLLWGVYTSHVMEEGIDQTIPALEKKLNYNFSIVLSYIHYNGSFPSEFMQKAYEKGKMVELTYQMTENNNENLFAESVSMRLYRHDPATIERIRQFARDAKALQHPFLFRLCNEMNSDWTSYGGVVNMADPDIFIENWRTFYQIFQEEGVDNCIWVYNPNNRNAPPDDWNGALNYYPGNEYVDLIGVTGYNTGTYYHSRWLEEWKGFTEIYDGIQDYYGKYFSAFPWMITEFSSSSIGGDKPDWIRSMFKNIGKYENIKAAVWFSFADYDENGNVARPYWLDETPDTLMAFRHGLTGAPEFRDLDGTEWAVEAICEVTDAGYFNGTSDTTFDPSLDMSRAMIYSVIARMAGIDTTTGSEWYEAGMNWAMEQGITDGSSPFASITREQMVTMLYRYATGDTEVYSPKPEPASGSQQNNATETESSGNPVESAGQEPGTSAGPQDDQSLDSVGSTADSVIPDSSSDAEEHSGTGLQELLTEDVQPLSADTSAGETVSAAPEAGPVPQPVPAGTNGTEPVPVGQQPVDGTPVSDPQAEEIDLSILSGFADLDSLSDWAKKAMVWAVANGIITGDDRGMLDPQGMATRAQVAVIISRFAKLPG